MNGAVAYVVACRVKQLYGGNTAKITYSNIQTFVSSAQPKP